MGIAVKLFGYLYIILGCLTLLSAALVGELTEQQRDQLQLFGIGIALAGLGLAILLSSHDRR